MTIIYDIKLTQRQNRDHNVCVCFVKVHLLNVCLVGCLCDTLNLKSKKSNRGNHKLIFHFESVVLNCCVPQYFVDNIHYHFGSDNMS